MVALIVEKSNGAERSAAADTVLLGTPSVVVIKASEADIARFEKLGDDGVITFKSGKVIRLVGFFKHTDDGQYHDLVLQGEDGTLLVYRPTDGSLFLPLEGVEELLYVSASGQEAALPPAVAVLSGGALGGAVFAATTGGNGGIDVSGPSRPVDNTPPSAPGLELETPVGENGLTSDPTVNVTDLEPGGTWEYSTDGGTTWQPGTGDSFELPGGSYEDGDVLVRQTDEAGNLGEEGKLDLSGPLVVDLVKPVAPGLEFETPVGDNGIVSDPTINVTDLEPGATWEYSTDGGTTWQPGTGDSFELPEGRYEDGDVLVRQTDEAGNLGEEGKLDLSGPILLDTQDPVAPGLALETPVGENGLTSDPTVSVTDLEPGGTWEYSTDGGTTWQPGTGDSFELPGGSYEDGDVLVRQTDEAGNLGPEGKLDLSGPIVVDTQDPAAPGLALETPVGESGLTSDATVNVSGLEQDATWEYSTDGGKTWKDGSGTSFELPEGRYKDGDVLVRQTDEAGNLGPEGKLDLPSAIIVDISEPAEPELVLEKPVNQNGYTNDTTVKVNGLEPGATWEYSTDRGQTWKPGSGNSFELDQKDYADGDILARQTDAAGNPGPEGQLAGDVKVDTSAPAAPTLTLDPALDLTEVQGDVTVEVGGLEPGATWQYSTDGGANWEDGSGTSFVLPGGSFENGDIVVVQTDKAGNPSLEGALTLNNPLVVDKTPPAAPTLTMDVNADGYTNDATVEVGNLEPGGTWEYSTDGGKTWKPGSGTSFELDKDGTYAEGDIQARQTDAFENLGPAGQLAGTVIVDTKAPAAPTLTLDPALDPTEVQGDVTVEVGGLEPGATWEYSTDGGATWTDGSGTSFDLPGGSFADGDIVVVQTDKAGNPSPEGSLTLTAPLVVDKTPPAAPTLTLETAVNADGYTNDATVEVGNLEPGGTWEYSTDGGKTWKPGSGTSFELDKDGTYAEGDIQARQTDAFENLGPAGQLAGAVIVDTKAPAAPTLTLDPALDPTEVQGDVTVEVGGLEPGATWEYSTDGGTTWTDGSGTSFDLPGGSFEDGDIVVVQTDKAGNPSLEGSLTLTDPLVVDKTPPAAPTLTMDVNEDGYTNDATVEVGGLEPGATWEYSTDGGKTWKPGSDTSFELDKDGTYAEGDILARQTDAAGNPGPEGQLAGAVIVDTKAPAALTVALVKPVNDDGFTNDATVQVSGLEPGATWQYSIDGSTWKDGSGTSFELDDDTYDNGNIMVVQTDAAGNLGPVSKLAGAVTVDTVPPAAPTAELDSSVDTQVVQNAATVHVGALEDGATWEYSVDGGLTWKDGSGSSFELTDGVYTQDDIVVRQTDIAGNTGPQTKVQLDNPLTIETGDGPDAPTLTLEVPVNAAGYTNDVTVKVNGLETGGTWEYSTDRGQTWKDGSGNSFELDDGTYAAGDILARQTDAAGNPSPEGQLAGAVIVDTVAPAAPTLTLDPALDPTEVQGDVTVEVGGLELGATWQYSTDGGTNWEDGSGTSFELPGGSFADGDIVVVQTDVAGNPSPEGSLTLTAPLVVDKTPPAAPTLTLDVNEDGYTNDFTVEVGGLEPGATWEYSTDGGATWKDGSGTSFELDDGTYAEGDILARQTDTFENLGPAGQLAGTVIVDTDAPAAPTLTLDPALDPTEVQGDVTVEVGGLEPGATWQYSTDGGATWTDGSGTSFDLPGGSFADGDIVVVQTDKAGNPSPEGSLTLTDPLVVDKTPPAAPTLTMDVNADGYTNDATVEVGGLEPGGTWEYSTDGGKTWKPGSGTSFELDKDGTYAEGDIQARQTDAFENLGPAGQLAGTVIVDTDAPAALSVELANDTGVDASDGITSDGTVTVSGFEAGAQWEYSLDGGDNWQPGGDILPGGGSSFVLPAGIYPAAEVVVRQIDKAGNVSNPTALNQTVQVVAVVAVDDVVAHDMGLMNMTVYPSKTTEDVQVLGLLEGQGTNSASGATVTVPVNKNGRLQVDVTQEALVAVADAFRIEVLDAQGNIVASAANGDDAVVGDVLGLNVFELIGDDTLRVTFDGLPAGEYKIVVTNNQSALAALLDTDGGGISLEELGDNGVILGANNQQVVFDLLEDVLGPLSTFLLEPLLTPLLNGLNGSPVGALVGGVTGLLDQLGLTYLLDSLLDDLAQALLANTLTLLQQTTVTTQLLDYGFANEVISGNVISGQAGNGADEIGSGVWLDHVLDADGTRFAVPETGSLTIEGKYGSLTISRDGSYTYTSKGDPASLGKSDEFTYGITDGYVSDTAKLTINLGGKQIDAGDDSGVGGIHWVAETDTDFVTVSSGVLIASGNTVKTQQLGEFSITEHQVLSGTIEILAGVDSSTTTGTLVIERQNSAGEWEQAYSEAIVLKDDSDYQEVLNSVDIGALDLGAGTYRIYATLKGWAGSVSPRVDIDMTQPRAETVNATGNLLENDSEGSLETGLSLIIDGMPTLVGAEGLSITTAYGVLTVQSNGDYVFAPNQALLPFNSPVTETFAYQITHPSGEVASSNLVITLSPSGYGVQPAAAPMMSLALFEGDGPIASAFSVDDENAAGDGGMDQLFEDDGGTVDDLLSGFEAEGDEQSDPQGDASLPDAANDGPVVDPLGYIGAPANDDLEDGFASVV